MGADDQRWSTREPREHGPSRRDRPACVVVGRRRPFRTRHLAWVVDKIAGDQRLLAFGRDAYADMARGMAERRHEADLIRDTVIGLDEIDQTGIEDRRHGSSGNR